MDNYYDIEEPKKRGFTVGKLLKWAAVALIAVVYIILIARCTMYGDDKIVSKILTNDATLEAYHADPAGFTVEQYGMNNPWIPVEDGRMVEFNNLYHIPAASQLQVSVKYNTDIAPYLGEDGLPFRFHLTDDDGNVYDRYFFEQKRKFAYNYIRLCFESITLEDSEKPLNENGKLERKSYTLHVERRNEDGSYTELCKYRVYDGSDISKKVDFSIK